ncbi:MAG TPA: hypothetical protein VJ323_12150 [Bryobacteraceae bacterium]|jgi:hypothetical protein|nr:hypothetical protein [Bryobacteraceae bacterium]
MKFSALVVAALVPACAYCAKARLYDMKSGDVFTANFSGKWRGTGHGKISLTLHGKKLAGEYATVPNGTSSWGSIYSSSGFASGSATAISARQRGSAIASGDGEVLECEYIVSGFSSHGSGACRDKEGNFYKLMF